VIPIGNEISPDAQKPLETPGSSTARFPSGITHRLTPLAARVILGLMTQNDPDRESIGAFVRRRRLANGLTQRALAEIAGVGVRFVSELERDKPTLRVGKVDAVLRVFGKRLGVVDASHIEVGP